MGDSLITIIAIFLAAILMFVFPLMAVSERSDDISELAVRTATSEFVDKVRTTGKLSLDEYDKYISTLSATGNAYEVDMEVFMLDDNPGVKTTQANMTKIGENIYYSIYTSQIQEKLNSSPTKKMPLKEGDIFSVTAKNTNKTISQLLRNFFYKISGNDTYQIAAKHGGIVTVNGTK